MKYGSGMVQPYEWNDVEIPGEWTVTKGMYEQVLSLRKINPDLKVMLAIGGWNHGGKPFTKLVASGVTMQRFAAQTTSFLRKYGFDGLDIDWEYPGSLERGGSDSDKERFTTLLMILRRQASATVRQTMLKR
jgi:chitinase